LTAPSLWLRMSRDSGLALGSENSSSNPRKRTTSTFFGRISGKPEYRTDSGLAVILDSHPCPFAQSFGQSGFPSKSQTFRSTLRKVRNRGSGLTAASPCDGLDPDLFIFIRGFPFTCRLTPREADCAPKNEETGGTHARTPSRRQIIISKVSTG
jgi:hypothetical protein